jgi:hypothetical protein
VTGNVGSGRGRDDPPPRFLPPKNIRFLRPRRPKPNPTPTKISPPPQPGPEPRPRRAFHPWTRPANQRGISQRRDRLAPPRLLGGSYRLLLTLFDSVPPTSSRDPGSPLFGVSDLDGFVGSTLSVFGVCSRRSFRGFLQVSRENKAQESRQIKRSSSLWYCISVRFSGKISDASM